MRTASLVLDQALDRVSGLEYQGPQHFVSHAPMACEALAALGLESALLGWVHGFEQQLGPAARPVPPRWGADFEWSDLVGDPRFLPEWLGYFERAIADDGWPSVVSRWTPRFLPGLSAALFHGVIRTSHAVRALEGADTPARRAELARALGNWATWLGPSAAPEGASDAAPGAAVRAAAEGACRYVTAPTIVHLHGVTGAMAVDLLVHRLTEAEAAAAVGQLRAEHRALYRGTKPWTPDGRDEDWDDHAAVAASRSQDAHQVKLVEACQRGLLATGDPAFSVAARTVTGLTGRR